MSEDREQKTEQATPHRLEQLRKDGKVAQSADVTSVAALSAGAVALALCAPRMATDLQLFTTRIVRLEDVGRPFAALAALPAMLGASAGPVVAATIAGAVIAGLVQTRGLVAWSLAAPKLERLDVTENIKHVIPTPDTLLDTLKHLLKVAAIGWAVWGVASDVVPQLTLLSSAPLPIAAMEAGHALFRVATRALLSTFVLAAVDFWIARRRFDRDTRMDREEIKQEHKEEEGDPHVKAQRRRRAREVGKRRGSTQVEGATVLVTNPTHYAVSLRYDPERDPAPIVLGKGVDEQALEMRREARRLGVPIVENRPFARALYAKARVGKTIPSNLFRVAAEVVAFVMRQRVGRSS